MRLNQFFPLLLRENLPATFLFPLLYSFVRCIHDG
jgi:hypothetical protein